MMRSAVLLLAAAPVLAERLPVLPQIDTPHDYYYREMYLPQLTSGPSALAWMPDGDALVYSMQGSLWRQSLDSKRAVQLTAGPGYDYQPDVSPDGEYVVFTRYDGDSLNLQLLHLASGAVRPLTRGSDVNVDPRFSPDGARLAFVSTRGSGRFHLFVGAFDGTAADGALESAALLPERRSSVARYYYSEFDHELSPAWSPDGREIFYVSNPETVYGTGAIWRRELAGGEATPVRVEETTWRARPDVSPDGRRVIYASYLGRQWHQLWLTTAAGGGDPLPLTYGDYDVSGARWSPDGQRIAYVANEHGGLAIRVQEFVGGRVTELEITGRDYLEPHGELLIRVVDRRGAEVPARLMVTGADGRRYAPHDAWLHADDGFDRRHADFEAQYFASDGSARLTVPAGAADVVAWRGPGYRVSRISATVVPGRTERVVVPMEALDLPRGWGRQLGADVHVHMNYGGHYRNTPARLAAQAAAEDLDVVFNLVVNKEQRIPDIRAFTVAPDPASDDATLILHGQEFHTSYWGHLGLLGLGEHLLIPDYSAYPNTGAASPYPDNRTIAELAQAQGALVGYVHPFLAVPDPAAGPITHALPVDAALGSADYYEVIGFADHRASAEVWYRLLDCGMPLAAAGGTDAMGNYATLRGPVGLNRTYVRVDGDPVTPAERRAAWLEGMRAGRSLATNGPLLGLTVNGAEPGAELGLSGSGRLRYRGFLRSAVPVDELQLVMNGRIVRRVDIDGAGTRADFDGEFDVAEDGWILLRAFSNGALPLLFDRYAYATTSAITIDVAGSERGCASSADYFLAWLDRIRESAAAHPDYNTAEERRIVLDNIDAAKAVFELRR